MKLPKSYYNMLSFAGTAIALTSFFLILFSIIVSTFLREGNSYLGLFSYILLPAILVIGLILIPLGMILTTRKAHKMGVAVKGKWSVIDFNNPAHRNALLLFGIVTLIFILFSSIGSYEAYHYTESTQFCGTVCHQVMEPEYVTYQHSGHARVTCVECHVGSGANWYVRSKLSGLYQVYSVMFNKYSKPIETPISNLRPAQETCEQCHWPQQFYTHKLRNEKHFLSDTTNTEWNIYLKVKTGSVHKSMHLLEGIHWHMNPDVKIEYISPTPNREIIPWVRYTNQLTGKTTVYEDAYEALEDSVIQASTPRTMDCMDCHNRPAHKYKTPAEFIDLALASGDIPNSIPQIKHVTMQILKDPFASRDTAHRDIDRFIRDYYTEQYPDFYAQSEDLIQKAINGVIQNFDQNIFPEMNASWDAYPDHIGHIEFNGCFRCHDDKHDSSTGERISKDCNLCHTILGQGTKDMEEMVGLNQSLEFQHPVDIEGAWKDYLCIDCHRYLY
jgi:nitrate/TMAO reductase-like tetraheme cytochrome c subunit